ncbi:hypothetical protein OB919_12055 [Halobacteria archaeon AArc-curdl1]|uniref:Uncharacterized protein n=1 Tax=Natronosalvus hydrolyticus TaxID=2979988 RepID=A0AAP2Z8K1_9EURY|nr:hypothetical protein [Halobacteria archaeon AArc-curdl1]
MRSTQSAYRDRKRTWPLLVVVIVGAGIALFIPVARVALAALVVLIGPLAIYGGLLAFLRGQIGVQRVRHVAFGLFCGTLTPIALVLALVFEWTLPIAIFAVSCSVLAVFFAIAGFSKERTPAGRHVPPLEEQ